MHNWLRSIVAIVALMLLGVNTAGAQQRQTGDVMYVYQKDGNVNSFVRSEIEEMSYSNEGIDSVEYDEPVTQLIATADSIYRFALSEIDSISFVTPTTVYKPGVIQLDGDLLQYVDRCDSMTIYFAASTPANLLPKVGDKLGIGYLNEKFPEGFAGVVKSVKGTTVECDHEDLEEIFETLFCVITTDVRANESEKSAARGRSLEVVTPYEKDFTLDPIYINMKNSLDHVLKVGPYAFTGENVMNASIKPTFHLKLEIAMRTPFGLRLSGTISGKIHAISKAAIYGSLEFAKDLAHSGRAGNFYGFGIDYKVGVFAKISGDITADVESRQQAEFSSGFAIGPKDMIHEKPVTTFKMTENKNIIRKASLDGLLGYGAVGEIGICWLKDNIAKGVLRIEFGPQYRSNIILTNTLIENALSSTALYDRLKNRTIQKYQVVGTSWDFYVMEKYGTTLPAPWGDEKLTDEWDIVPKFYNTELIQNTVNKTTADGSTVAKGDCAFEHTLGMALHDSNGRYYDMGDWTYLPEKEFKSGRQDLNYTFKDLKDDDSETYKLYPMVVVGGFLPILASPSADLEKEPFPVRIVSFEQTSSHYSKQQGYEYEGKNYFYKFNATTTVELNPEAQHIKDWGYIYHDIYGVDKKISCANLGSNPYADIRYAYYYNDKERTVELSPYVQYDDGNDILVGRRYSYYVEYTIPVHIIGLQQTGSQYSEDQSFVYEGKGYSYKFNVATTVELDGEEPNVKDWGYIYHDFYGVDKKISCANLGSNPYIDTRYAYYYNEPKRTVELSPYIQYNGEDITEGRKTTFNLEHSQYEHYCPDNNHPHWIDLGLPSGTKWCCCNAGALYPHEYGGYYAWGETHQKSVYSWDTYQYYTPPPTEYQRGTLTRIGADISGSGYDPCDVGRMPTQAEQRELFSNTNREWSDAGHTTMLNGVNGIVFTGKNGNKIFLPYCGYKKEEQLVGENATARYWTGTATSDYARGNGSAAECYTYYGGILTGSNVCLGYSVRPVR